MSDLGEMGVEFSVIDPGPLGSGSSCAVEIIAGEGLSVRPGAAVSGASIAWVRDRLSACLAHLGCTGEVRVRLVGDAEMCQAHHRHCGVTGTTDVITFDLAEGASATSRVLDVDILVCVDEAHRQAGNTAHRADRELLLYTLHGVLHCLGHDDHDDAAYEKMHQAEDEILKAVGVGAVFRPPDPS